MKKTIGFALLLFATVVAAGPPTMIKLKAKLSGASIGGIAPSGHASFHERVGPPGPSFSKLNVEVEDVNENIGTILGVLVNGVSVGTIALTCPTPEITLADKDCEEGELELSTLDGQIVPAVIAGTVVSVVDPTGATILTGVFGPFPVKKTHKGRP